MESVENPLSRLKLPRNTLSDEGVGGSDSETKSTTIEQATLMAKPQHQEEKSRKASQHEKGNSSSTNISGNGNGNGNGNAIVSTYDWPMTSTEKLMDKYAYKVDLTQYMRRIDAVLPLLGSEKRDLITQGFVAIGQVIEEAWANIDTKGDLVLAICNHLQQKGNLESVLHLFISGEHDLRLEAGKMLESCLSAAVCSYFLTEGYIKDIVKTITQKCDRANDAMRRLCVSLLETLFRHGSEVAKITLDYGGLDYLIDICKSPAEMDTLLHTAAALSNLAIAGGEEIHKLMVKQRVPDWLFVLASQEDTRIRYYACLTICVIASTKDIERSVQECDTILLVIGFLKTQKPENMAKLDDKYRAGRTKQYLEALVPLLNSPIPQVSAMGLFQLAMEASLRKGTVKIDAVLQVFDELSLLARIKELIAAPGYQLGVPFGEQILKAIGEVVPHKLSQCVPLWTVKDVQYWLKRVGYDQYAGAFARHRVDGDLLLRTTNEHLKNDVGMNSAYERMRFARELNSLKRSADYSSVDKNRLDTWLISLDPELSVYTYQLLLKGVDRQSLLHLDDDILSNVCGMRNGVHRWKIIRAVQEAKHVADLDLVLLRKKVDVFICYRRSTGSQLASLLKVHLQLSGYKVFIDVDRLFAGHLNKSILMNVRAAKHFILVLSPRALDPCVGDEECKDWVHLELKTALESKSNIIPVQEKGFQWPSAEKLPADVRTVCNFNAIQWVHDYQQACIDKLHKAMQKTPT